MANAENRSIHLLSDLDGIQYLAPPPLKTAIELLHGHLNLPLEGNNSPDRKQQALGLVGIALDRLSLHFHQVRPVNPRAKKVLNSFREIAESYNYDISISVLSGRDKDVHNATKSRLAHDFGANYFSHIFLKTSGRASLYKEVIIKEILEADGSVVAVHIEDDLRAALCIARLAERFPGRVIVYLQRNLSNCNWLRERAQVELPDNVRLFSAFEESAADFEKRLAKGEI